MALSKPHVHAQQVRRKQGGLVATGARPNFQKYGACVVWVFGQEHALQLGFELGQFCLSAGDFFLCHLAQCVIRPAVLQHLLGGLQVRLALLEARVAARAGGELCVLAR